MEELQTWPAYILAAAALSHLFFLLARHPRRVTFDQIFDIGIFSYCCLPYILIDIASFNEGKIIRTTASMLSNVARGSELQFLFLSTIALISVWCGAALGRFRSAPRPHQIDARSDIDTSLQGLTAALICLVACFVWAKSVATYGFGYINQSDITNITDRGTSILSAIISTQMVLLCRRIIIVRRSHAIFSDIAVRSWGVSIAICIVMTLSFGSRMTPLTSIFTFACVFTAVRPTNVLKALPIALAGVAGLFLIASLRLGADGDIFSLLIAGFGEFIYTFISGALWNKFNDAQAFILSPAWPDLILGGFGYTSELPFEDDIISPLGAMHIMAAFPALAGWAGTGIIFFVFSYLISYFQFSRYPFIAAIAFHGGGILAFQQFRDSPTITISKAFLQYGVLVPCLIIATLSLMERSLRALRVAKTGQTT